MRNIFPNRENIVNDEQVPVPIETAFFLEDGQRDPTKFNRYYFNFPAQWSTSNRGESIIGVRNIWLLPRTRKIEFKLSIRKYYKSDYDKILYSHNVHSEEADDLYYSEIPKERKSEVTCKITSWLTYENDFRQLWKDVNDAVRAAFDVVNPDIIKSNNEYRKHLDSEIEKLSDENSEITLTVENLDKMINELETQLQNATTEADKNSIQQNLNNALNNRRKYIDEINKLNKKQKELEDEMKEDYTPVFNQDEKGSRIRDVQMDGYYDYDKKVYVETIYSPNNEKPKTFLDVVHTSERKYYTDFKIDFNIRPYDENNIQINSPYRRYDFADVMNIGMDPNQNRPDKYMIINRETDIPGFPFTYVGKWMRELIFENVWDRHSCKVYSSIAEESHGFIGNSQKDYVPIKYFKLNSTDQRFWVEFYSGRHNNIPVKIPDNESFVIEMQFMPFRKMLYV